MCENKERKKLISVSIILNIRLADYNFRCGVVKVYQKLSKIVNMEEIDQLVMVLFPLIVEMRLC